MKVMDIGAAVDASRKTNFAASNAIFAAKVGGEVKFVKVKGVLTKHSEAVVVECPYGENGNYDVIEKEAILVLHRNMLRVAYSSPAEFRKEAIAKGAAAAFEKMNY